MTTAIILAGGKSTRMGDGVDKAFLSLVNKPMVAWSLLAFERSPEIDRIVLVVRKDQLLASKAVVKMFGISKLDKIVPGGTKRQESVQAGLDACDADTRIVVVHDAARHLGTRVRGREGGQARRRRDGRPSNGRHGQELREGVDRDGDRSPREALVCADAPGLPVPRAPPRLPGA